MDRKSKIEALRGIINGELTPKDLLPKAIVIITEDGKKKDPATMEPWHPVILENAEFIVTLPANGRETPTKK